MPQVLGTRVLSESSKVMGAFCRHWGAAKKPHKLMRWPALQDRTGWKRSRNTASRMDLESKMRRQVLEVASGFRQRIRSLQSELAQARREIEDLRHRLGSGESPLVA